MAEWVPLRKQQEQSIFSALQNHLHTPGCKQGKVSRSMKCVSVTLFLLHQQRHVLPKGTIPGWEPRRRCNRLAFRRGVTPRKLHPAFLILARLKQGKCQVVMCFGHLRPQRHGAAQGQRRSELGGLAIDLDLPAGPEPPVLATDRVASEASPG